MSIERPKNPTPEMKMTAALQVVDELITYGHIETDDRDDAAAELAKMSWCDDGYEIARELDRRHYWDCCMGMLESLDCFGSLVDRQLDEAQKQWVTDNDIQPPLPVGTKVELGDDTGVLTGVSDYGAAKYLVAVDGSTTCSIEQSGRRVVNFEDVRAIQ